MIKGGRLSKRILATVLSMLLVLSTLYGMGSLQVKAAGKGSELGRESDIDINTSTMLTNVDGVSLNMVQIGKKNKVTYVFDVGTPEDGGTAVAPQGNITEFAIKVNGSTRKTSPKKPISVTSYWTEDGSTTKVSTFKGGKVYRFHVLIQPYNGFSQETLTDTTGKYSYAIAVKDDVFEMELDLEQLNKLGETDTNILSYSGTYTIYSPGTYHTLSFDMNGHGDPKDKPEDQRVLLYSKPVKPTVIPTDPKYNFLFWAYDTGYRFSFDNMLLQDYTVYAKWQEKPSYTVSFDENGGTGTMDSETFYYDGEEGTEMSYTLPDNAFIGPSGRTFVGWFVDGNVYDEGDTITLTKSVNVRALWNTDNFTVEDLKKFYTYTEVEGGYKLGLTNGFKDRLNENKYYEVTLHDDTKYVFLPGEMLPNPESTYKNSEGEDVPIVSYENLFMDLSKATKINISSWDTSNVTNMSGMFSGCSGLQDLVIGDIDTSNVKNMSYMFHGCSGLKTVDLSGLETENVTNMSYMFTICFNLESLNLENFDTRKVTHMMGMFNDCSALKSLKLGKLETTSVLTMADMFNNCKSLESLDLSIFKLSNSVNVDNMFKGTCENSATVVKGFAMYKEQAELLNNSEKTAINPEKLKFEETYFELTFDYAGHKDNDSLILYKGDTISKPADPENGRGYKFDNWYTDDSYTVPYVFGEPIISDTTIWANYKDTARYSVKFDLNDHGKAISDITACEGDSLEYFYTEEVLKDPESYGYEFGGWYTDKECTDAKKYDVTAVISSDIQLYAKWTKTLPEPTKTYSFEVKNGNMDDVLSINDRRAISLLNVVSAIKVDVDTRIISSASDKQLFKMDTSNVITVYDDVTDEDTITYTLTDDDRIFAYESISTDAFEDCKEIVMTFKVEKIEPTPVPTEEPDDITPVPTEAPTDITPEPTDVPSDPGTLTPDVTPAPSGGTQTIPTAAPTLAPTAAPAGTTEPAGVPEKAGKTIAAPEGNANYKVVSSDVNAPTVEYIESSDKEQKDVVIPDSVSVNGVSYKIAAISSNAFKGNTTLKTVKMGNNVKTIGAGAFEGCSGLSSVTLGSNVEEIGEGSFKGCKNLTKIVIPAKVKYIRKNAFSGCSKLKTMIVKTKKLKKKTVGANAFKGVSKKATVKVPKKLKKTYKKLFRSKGLPKKVKFK